MIALTDTKGWKLRYRFTPTGRRVQRWLATDGVLWEETTEAKATHIRTFTDLGLSPMFMRQVGTFDDLPEREPPKMRKKRKALKLSA